MPTAAHNGDLTPRQLEVARLAADGLGNREIGEALSISEHTVKSHINAILQKQQVTDRRQIRTAAKRPGLIVYVDGPAQETVVDVVLSAADHGTQRPTMSQRRAFHEAQVNLSPDELVMKVLPRLRLSGNDPGTERARGKAIFCIRALTDSALVELDRLVLPSQDGLTVALQHSAYELGNEQDALAIDDQFHPFEVEGQPFFAWSWARGPVRRTSPGRHEVNKTLGDLGDVFALTDFDVNVDRFRRSIGDEPNLALRLETALCLNPKVIAYAPELARLPEFGHALEQYETFLTDGSIALLLPSKVDAPGELPGYLRDQARTYWESGEGTRDIRSLNLPFKDPELLDRACRLVDLCGSQVKRGFGATRRFYDALRNDLKEQEQLAIGGLPSPLLEQHDLTLRQLLAVSIIGPSGTADPILDPVALSEVVESFRQIIEKGQRPGSKISRNIALSLFRKAVGDPPHAAVEDLFSLIEARLHRLYAISNYGLNAGFEIDPRRDRFDPYSERYLYEHLEHLVGREATFPLGPERLRHLRSESRWWEFVDYHLSSVRDALRSEALTGEGGAAARQSVWQRDGDKVFEVLRDILAQGR